MNISYDTHHIFTIPTFQSDKEAIIAIPKGIDGKDIAFIHNQITAATGIVSGFLDMLVAQRLEVIAPLGLSKETNANAGGDAE